ncbi:hypothetical protein LTS17_001731 [Exophiala oligosperma]
MLQPVPEDVMEPPEYFNFAADVVDRWSESDPGLLAMQWISDQSKTPLKLTYEHFSVQSNKAAALLRKLGAKPGDRVMMVLNRVPAWWEIATGVLRAGLVLCPCTTLATAKDIEYRLISSAANIFVGNQASIASLAKIRKNCPALQVVLQADGEQLPGVIQYQSAVDGIATGSPTAHKTKKSDPALIYFTSGTSGPPKMRTCSRELTGWAYLPESSLGHWRSKVGQKQHALERCVAAGEPLDEGTLEAWRAMTGLQIREGYGQTETILVAGSCEGVQIRPGSMGKALPGVPLHVIDDVGRPVTAGVEGEIAVLSVDERGQRTPFVCDGYMSKEGSLSHKSRTRLSSDGSVNGQWHLTGDRAYQDADGYLWYVGRSDDVINSSGYRIGELPPPRHTTVSARRSHLGNIKSNRSPAFSLSGPFEVESALKLHPAVLEAAVIGVKDHSRGEVVKAFIVAEQSVLEQQTPEKLKKELQEHCKKEAAPYKYPRLVEFVKPEWLPKTISGKIQRAEIRRRERESARTSHL